MTSISGHRTGTGAQAAFALLVVLASVATATMTGCPVNGPATSTGTVHVDAMLDGSPWTGPVDFAVAGQPSGSSVPMTYSGVPAGSHALEYLSGGPADASFVGATPSGRQTLTAGGAISFTLDFRTIEMARSNIVVMAILKQAEGDVSWMGDVNFVLTGREAIVGASVPGVYNGMPVSEYTLEYVSGGPPNTSFVGITPPSPQFLSVGDTLIFKMEFE